MVQIYFHIPIPQYRQANLFPFMMIHTVTQPATGFTDHLLKEDSAPNTMYETLSVHQFPFSRSPPASGIKIVAFIFSSKYALNCIFLLALHGLYCFTSWLNRLWGYSTCADSFTDLNVFLRSQYPGICHCYGHNQLFLHARKTLLLLFKSMV